MGKGRDQHAGNQFHMVDFVHDFGVSSVMVLRATILQIAGRAPGDEAEHGRFRCTELVYPGGFFGDFSPVVGTFPTARGPCGRGIRRCSRWAGPEGWYQGQQVVDMSANTAVRLVELRVFEAGK